MPVFLMPEFIVDLQSHGDAHFARRVLQKTLNRHGGFRTDAEDHRYNGVEDAWIRYVSRGNSAYRVIYIRDGTNVYLYRAGEHAIEKRLAPPQQEAMDAACTVGDVEGSASTAAALAAPLAIPSPVGPPPNRLLRNNPATDISNELLSRRPLPHRDIWLVAPFINAELLQPTARLGKLIFDQIDDGAKAILITAPPKNKDIGWLERLQERELSVYFYPRLHSKLFCFVLDESRKHARELPDPNKLSSLLLVGSANLTRAGLALGATRWNEELCYTIPEAELSHVETYVTDLITRGYDLQTARAFLARGQWHKLESNKW